MATSIPVSQQFVSRLCALLPGVRRTRAGDVALLVFGLIRAAHVGLPKVAAALGHAGRGVRDASIERPLRRWLANDGVDIVAIWSRLFPIFLHDWANREIVLAFDATPHRKRWTILLVGVVQHCRVLPLGSTVVPQ